MIFQVFEGLWRQDAIFNLVCNVAEVNIWAAEER